MKECHNGGVGLCVLGGGGGGEDERRGGKMSCRRTSHRSNLEDILFLDDVVKTQFV